MSPSSTVVNIPDRHVQWPKLIMARCHRNDCLIAPENDRYKHGTMRFIILGNDILLKIRRQRTD